ncbi:hypothetical protein K505DRAFT_66463 [Melanomma pulvis-pyrius CBS 109.77]|uniref:Uncharacterized protein n=1 Tax=Melanomma pulvis-pyrius CBS 109.77 TaxID=1314802 RepID=A0A6A6X5A5_9PLEO|nr:hypothetical protein K505DRAFT_66463 [Melanomma pulvis-pyrius CBS 109.77]
MEGDGGRCRAMQDDAGRCRASSSAGTRTGEWSSPALVKLGGSLGQSQLREPSGAAGIATAPRPTWASSAASEQDSRRRQQHASAHSGQSSTRAVVSSPSRCCAGCASLPFPPSPPSPPPSCTTAVHSLVSDRHPPSSREGADRCRPRSTPSFLCHRGRRSEARRLPALPALLAGGCWRTMASLARTWHHPVAQPSSAQSPPAGQGDVCHFASTAACITNIAPPRPPVLMRQSVAACR